MSRVLLAVALMGLGIAGFSGAAAGLPMQTAPAKPLSLKAHAGQEMFQKNCMQCHAVLEGQYSFGPNLMGEMKKPHPKKTPVEVREIIKNGKGKMPAFGEKLTTADTDDLIEYIRTL